MGSEGPSVVTVHVTGFKKFHGVAENPTEKIVTNLKSFMEKRGLPKNLVLGSCTVLETAGEGALGTLHKVLETAIADRENSPSAQGQVIWIHFGVNSGAMRFALENQAVNEATFRCPDELGWKPQRVPIVPSDGGISRTREFFLTSPSAPVSTPTLAIFTIAMANLTSNIPGNNALSATDAFILPDVSSVASDVNSTLPSSRFR
ncbi:hypothetical protein PR202_ga29010 [Eleusine coracana subsp. coracana]|uniref:Pyrrolidone-carboxylate peptidase n=1 Tax=Eleusine coracana subsp. coracana TaxID=191504 RepID=A0AAV5DL95_ELECO|nr:hypothetical protein PR202_ga29010 [Eleusine coracana subsp. coracana]